MAHYQGYVAKVIVTDIPRHFYHFKAELKMQLEKEVGNGEILDIQFVTNSSAEILLRHAYAKEKVLKAQIINVVFRRQRFQLKVAQFDDENSVLADSDDDSDRDSEDEDVYTYEPPDKDSKNILRYLSKTPAHEHSLKLALSKCGCKLINVSKEVIEAAVLENGRASPQQACEDCIEHFMERFSTWDEILDNCSSTDEKRIISILTKYKAKCFGNWYRSSSTILVTGPKEVVEEVKELVEELLDVQHTEGKRNEMLSYDAEDVPVAVLKFACHDEVTQKSFMECCKPLARVLIKNEHGQIKIYVIFKNKDYSSVHKAKADSLIKEYFSKFDTQTKKYSPEKLKEILKNDLELFSREPGVLHIAHFEDTGTVKITGLKKEVLRKALEIKDQMHAEIEVKLLLPDIYIAQRECEVWAKVNELCKQEDLAVSITSSEPGLIQYKGRPQFIIKAKKLLEKVYEGLYEKIVRGLSPAQITFLVKFVKLQQNFLETKVNKLDAIYDEFRKRSIQGSLMIQPPVGVKLICRSLSEWKRAMDLLSKLIGSIEVDLSTTRKAILFSKLFNSLKSELEDLMVHVESQADAKKIQVYCLIFQKPKIQKRVREIQKEICNTEEDEKFYPMPEEIARHIKNRPTQCKVHQVKLMNVVQRDGEWGLAVTYDKEDIDTVDMSFEDLKSEIVHKNLKISGYSLYEYLDSDNKQYLVERETDCSIFLKPEGQVQCTNIVSVKEGDILSEKCETLINSSGRGLGFSGQISLALTEKYGRDALDMALQGRQWFIKEQAVLCQTSGLLPWTYVINVNPPADEKSLKKFILKLLLRADKAGMKSMAMPTMGAGNLGLDPVVVAKCLKEAFYSFIAQPVCNLKDVRVVVYERSLLSAFKDIAPKQDSRSTAMFVTIYGNSQASLEKAAEKLKEYSKTYIASRVIENASMCQFPPYVKAQAREICDKNGVQLIWKQKGNHEQCHLQGITDSVKRAEDEIRNLAEADFPANWSVMADDHAYVKKSLDKASPEYIQVRSKFQESSPAYVKILKIERIQNPSMYKQFKTRKDIKQTENSSLTVTKWLFHGTSADKVDKICASGFDRNYAGENGAAYGKGVYFAVRSGYSVRYAKISGDPPRKCIFLAEVITGDFTQGNSRYKAPPEKGSSKVLYDSVVDDVTSPQMYVVFHDASVYPLYLITFL